MRAVRMVVMDNAASERRSPMEDKKLNELRAEYSLAVRTADTIRETIANIRASLVPLEESLDY